MKSDEKDGNIIPIVIFTIHKLNFILFILHSKMIFVCYNQIDELIMSTKVEYGSRDWQFFMRENNRFFTIVADRVEIYKWREKVIDREIERGSALYVEK